MTVKWYFGRFLYRQYVYPLLCLLLILLLLKWNTQPTKVIIEHEKYHDGLNERVSSKTDKAKGVEDLPQPAKEIVDTQSGNSVHIAVYMEAQCPDTSRFIKKHLVPTWQRLRSTGRVEIALVPFGKARCERVGDDFKCDCQHGSNECELNQLMNCAINEFNFADHYVPLIGCIQGSNNVNAAIEKCIQKGHYNQYTDRLRECATGPRGRHLLALAGQKTTALSPPLTFVPWVMLDGARSTDAYWALEENVCKLLDPQPPECQPVMAAAKAAAARI